jgi:redox-sensitive bicupin YhaK (pirin superfamily)
MIKYAASEKSLMGTPIRRVLPTAKKRMVGHFIFLDHMGPVRYKVGADTSVGAHPHIGLATLTYLFEGRIHHRDSLGSSQVITPGEVNWMIAGRGISHSERGVKGDELKEHPMHGLQFWVALPDSEEDCEPQFFNFKEVQIPKTEKTGFTVKEIVGPQSPFRLHQTVFC